MFSSAAVHEKMRWQESQLAPMLWAQRALARLSADAMSSATQGRPSFRSVTYRFSVASSVRSKLNRSTNV